jgi:hypothetical protein
MSTIQLIRSSSKANLEILNSLRQITDSEGRKFHAVLDETLRDF